MGHINNGGAICMRHKACDPGNVVTFAWAPLIRELGHGVLCYLRNKVEHVRYDLLGGPKLVPL